MIAFQGFCLAEDSRSDDYRQFWARLNKGEFMSDRFRRVTKQGQQVWLRVTYPPFTTPTAVPMA